MSHIYYQKEEIGKAVNKRGAILSHTLKSNRGKSTSVISVNFEYIYLFTDTKRTKYFT